MTPLLHAHEQEMHRREPSEAQAGLVDPDGTETGGVGDPDGRLVYRRFA